MSAHATSTLHVDLNAYAHNLRVIQKMLENDCLIVPVVKSDAYGHGMVPIASRALQANISMLAVATVGEGLVLREAFPMIPILCLVQPSDDELMAGIRTGLRFTVSDLGTAERIGELAHKAKKIVAIHCEVDTGMGRQGFHLDESAKSMLKITRISNIDLEGVFTHFPVADARDESFTANQIRSFKQLLKQLARDGIPFEVGHAANSAAILNHPDSHFDVVRPGIITYGIYPDNVVPGDSPFEPVASWTSRIVLLRELPADAGISYGRRYKTTQQERIAVVPVGYGDGYPRALSNRADVLVRGQRCPVRGTVTMNQIMIDVTHVGGVAVGDTVTLIGEDGEQGIRAEELADRAGTIGYEIMTGIGPQVAREYHPAIPVLEEA
ncbi:MAG: alanine racemase [Candidatus Hydrogenedentota bacterium]